MKFKMLTEKITFNRGTLGSDGVFYDKDGVSVVPKTARVSDLQSGHVDSSLFDSDDIDLGNFDAADLVPPWADKHADPDLDNQDTDSEESTKSSKHFNADADQETQQPPDGPIIPARKVKSVDGEKEKEEIGGDGWEDDKKSDNDSLVYRDRVTGKYYTKTADGTFTEIDF